jgi:hypothetical protein
MDLARNAHRANVPPVIRVHGRSFRRCRRNPVSQRLKQVTNFAVIDAFAHCERATVDIVANGREPSPATGQWHVDGVIPQRLSYLGRVSVHEVTARGANQNGGDEKQAPVRREVFGQHLARLDTSLRSCALLWTSGFPARPEALAVASIAAPTQGCATSQNEIGWGWKIA